MTPPLILALLWLAAAQATGLLRPARVKRAVVVALIICGIPLLGGVTADAGPFVGLGLLAAGVLSLRWPLSGVLRTPDRDDAWREPAE